MPTSTSTDAPAAARERAFRNVNTSRRRRVLRALVLFVGGLATVVLLSLYTRDQQAVREDARVLDLWAGALRQTIAERGSPPLDLPSVSGADAKIAADYDYNLAFVQQAKDRGRAAVAWREHRLPLYLRGAGRHVLFFEDGRYNLRWTPDPELESNAERWGIRP